MTVDLTRTGGEGGNRAAEMNPGSAAEAMLGRTLILAQRVADAAVADAQHQAELLLAEAHRQAGLHLAEAHRQAEERLSEVERLLAERRLEAEREASAMLAEAERQAEMRLVSADRQVEERLAEVDRLIRERRVEAEREAADWLAEADRRVEQRLAEADRHVEEGHVVSVPEWPVRSQLEDEAWLPPTTLPEANLFSRRLGLVPAADHPQPEEFPVDVLPPYEEPALRGVPDDELLRLGVEDALAAVGESHDRLLAMLEEQLRSGNVPQQASE